MFQFSLPVLGQRGVRQTFTFGLCIAPLFAGIALAQHAHDMSTMVTPTATPAGVVKDVAPLQFESVLSRYKPMTDQKLGSWREANDTVTRIGGWRTYLKEAQSPDAAPPSPASAPMPAPVVPSQPNPHAGHGGKP
jgi:hypothetical protein